MSDRGSAGSAADADQAAANPPAAYAVIGHPVAHSLSPLIHREFAAATGEAVSYDLLPAAEDGFVSTAQAFFADGGAGLNVTLPFKEQAAALVDRLDPAAATAGAVNTIRREPDGSLSGFNTDGAGLLQDLQVNLGWSLAGSRILLIGAGGASRGSLASLLAAEPAELVLANRTRERAEQLIEQVAPAARNLSVSSPAEVAGRFDVIINATSASLAGQGALVATDAVGGARCYDMLYARTQTVFAGWAASFGAQATADGLGMLIEQAAAAFEIWRGVRPSTRSLLERREALFAAQAARAESLATAASSPAEPADSAVLSSGRPTRQFIAGAVCPECRETDRLVVQNTSAGRQQLCISCGYQSAAPESNSALVPQGKLARAERRVDAETIEAPVRLIDPHSRDGSGTSSDAEDG